MTDGSGISEAPAPGYVGLVAKAAEALKAHRDEINKLNVFPVPDGDTGTNMSLTMDAVVAEVGRLGEGATLAEVCHAVTHGSLMGARGNSGVILSQILRGFCESLGPLEHVDAQAIADALARSVEVAFQAVRKPVEGTILTVLKDAAAAAPAAVEAGEDITGVVEAAVAEAFESVRRTPDLLPVLKEANVVDAGGYGLAVLAEGFAAALGHHEIRSFDVTVRPGAVGPIVATLPEDDWDDQEYLYCTEFLLFGEGLDRDAIEERIAAAGGSELVVGAPDQLKIHVHTNDPSEVLAYALSLGDVAEVHINNMRLQTAARARELRVEADAARKPLGFVAVAAGDGLAEILRSLGVDAVVSGGQTMNPSTAELLDAINSVSAEAVVVLPNNRNIILAANQTVGIADKPVGVVPTSSVPESFSAMLVADSSAELEANVAAMTDAAAAVRTGEVTTAIKDSKGKAGSIKAGQLIGISDHEIEVVGEDLADVASRLLDVIAQDGETLLLLAGEDLDDTEFERIQGVLASAHPDLEVEAHRGAQPLYPLIMAVE